MPRILFVEDEIALTDTLRRFFEREGFDVYTARSRTEALEITQRFPPDVALLDVMLPKQDGFDVCRAVRSAGVRIPIVLLTATVLI